MSNGINDRPMIVPSHGHGGLRPLRPGETANPSGVSKDSLIRYHEARRLCAQASPEAVRKQIELMQDDDSRVAFIATEAVLNRGIGKAGQHGYGDDKPPVDLSALNPDERKTLAELLLRTMGAK